MLLAVGPLIPAQHNVLMRFGLCVSESDRVYGMYMSTITRAADGTLRCHACRFYLPDPWGRFQVIPPDAKPPKEEKAEKKPAAE